METKTIRWKQAGRELKTLVLAIVYFATCFWLILVLEKLFLAEYHIRFAHLSIALVIAIVVAKVVLILDHLPLLRALHRHVIAVEITIRTLVYSGICMAALVIEKSLESRYKHESFASAVTHFLEREDLNQILATALCVTITLLGYNLFAILKIRFPEPISQLFFSTSRKDIASRGG